MPPGAKMNTRPRHASESGLDAATAVADCSAGEKLLQSEYRAAARSAVSVFPSQFGIDMHGLGNQKQEHWNLPTAALYEHAIQRGEGHIVHLGPLVVRTGKHTGRAAKDKYFVNEPSSRDHIDWKDGNQPMDPKAFDWLQRKAVAYLQNRTVYVMDVWAGHDRNYRMPVRVITETAWHALFVRNMFVRPLDEELPVHKPQFTVIHVPGMQADPVSDGVRRSTFIGLHMGKGEAVIGGTFYAGEIKKAVFTAMNYYLPRRGVLTMHSAANVGKDGRSAVFFGLSGTGKTTLSTDPERALIGDDEIGWSDTGVFNIEGGCYAKLIGLNREAEPDIWRTTRQFGTIVENTIMNPVTRTLDLSDNSITENTRAAYPLHCIENRRRDGMGGVPSTVVMLTCDAFGVLPPVSLLTPAQAEFWFLLGYTAKVAGTEVGVSAPTATFSACFGLPFMPLKPTVYSRMLREKIERHGVKVYLLNTGWTGGTAGTGAKRFSIQHTRAILSAALDGHLAGVPLDHHDVFNLDMPTECPGVPDELLNPRAAWSDCEAYDATAAKLAQMCCDSFKPFMDLVGEDVKASAPMASMPV